MRSWRASEKAVMPARSSVMPTQTMTAVVPMTSGWNRIHSEQSSSSTPVKMVQPEPAISRALMSPPSPMALKPRIISQNPRKMGSVDLVMKQHGCNAYGAICRLEQGNTASFSFHGKDLPERDTKRQAASPIEIRRIQPLQNPALIRYLQERGISPGTASPYVQEMYYRIGGKPYFALAFKNDSGGYELRNPRFKGSTSKDITHIRQQGEPRDTCFVFEGFLDFLSFLTIRQQKSPDMPCTDWQDYVILNSTANTDKALYPLADYGHIHCMLDNDEAGRKAVEAIRQEYKWRVRDASHLYSGHNDLNDYLRSLKVKQSQDLTVTDKPQPEQDNRQNPGEKRKRGLRM